VALIVSGTGLLVGKHSVATFHVEDFIINTAVVSLLMSQVVELLTELSDELIFFTAANSNSVAVSTSHLQKDLFLSFLNLK
jgi:hypothetical protein